MMLNLLQRGFNPQAQQAANQQPDGAAMVGGFIGLCVGLTVLAGLLGTLVLILVRAMQALTEVRDRNRSMQPMMVWLSLIPCLNVVWNFMVVLQTSTSLSEEFADRGLRSRGDHGKSLGLTFAVIPVVNILLAFLSIIPFVGLVTSCLTLVLIVVQVVVGVLYASKLSAATNRLRDDGDGPRGRGGDDDDDDEPKPRKKPRKPADDDEFEDYDEPKGGR